MTMLWQQRRSGPFLAECLMRNRGNSLGSDWLGEKRPDWPPLSTLRHVTRRFLELEWGGGGDGKWVENRGVQIADGDGVFGRQQRPFGGGFAIEEGFFHAAAEEKDGAGAGEVPMQAVVDHLLHHVGLGA